MIMHNTHHRTNGKSSQNNGMAVWHHNGVYYDIRNDYSIA